MLLCNTAAGDGGKKDVKVPSYTLPTGQQWPYRGLQSGCLAPTISIRALRAPLVRDCLQDAPPIRYLPGPSSLAASLLSSLPYCDRGPSVRPRPRPRGPRQPDGPHEAPNRLTQVRAAAIGNRYGVSGSLCPPRHCRGIGEWYGGLV
jgi:hypothetical protein